MMRRTSFFFFFNDTATTEIYTLSLHDALPISRPPGPGVSALPSRDGRAGDDLEDENRMDDRPRWDRPLSEWNRGAGAVLRPCVRLRPSPRELAVRRRRLRSRASA